MLLWCFARLIRRFSASVPRTVLDSRFYRPRSRHKARETARTPHRSRINVPANSLVCRGFVALLTPSSFGSRFGKEKQQNSFLDPLSGLHFNTHCLTS